PSALERLGRRALRRMKLRALLATRGRDGMVLFERGRKPAWLRILGSEEAVDVTGAGDTVIAAFTLALAAGADFFHAAQIANSAAGQKSAPAESASVNAAIDRKSTRLNSSHVANSDAVLCLKKQQQV